MSIFRLFFLNFCALLLASCTPLPEKVFPPEHVMHFPFAMAIKNNTLLVSSQSPDHKYSFGRLMAFDTNTLAHNLKNNWRTSLQANTLIAPDVASLSFKDVIMFASRDNNTLYVTKEPLCNKPHELVTNCPSTASLQLAHNDPYALEVIQETPEKNIILVSYLSSDNLDIIGLNKQRDTPELRLIKTFNMKAWFAYEDIKISTKKIIITNNHADSQIFLLLEKTISNEFIRKKNDRDVNFKLDTLIKNTGSMIVAISADNLLQQEEINTSMLKIWDLNQILRITSAQDFYISKNNNTAIILSRSPEMLFKLDLQEKAPLERQLLCRGASSMAVSQVHDRLFVPCFYDNTILSFSLSSLGLYAASRVHGRGAAFAVVDDEHEQLFVSYNLGGTVAVFDFALNYKGDIFDAAPRNRVGS